jgi:hypothetical protein
MIALLAALGCILVFAFRRKKRALEEKGGNTFIYHFTVQALDFLTPFAVITISFLLLSLFVSAIAGQATFAFLSGLETSLTKIKGVISVLKITPVIAFCVLFLIFLLNLLGMPSLYTIKFFPVYKKYQKVVKKIYTIVVILCSFTFFGTQLGDPIAKLRFRIESIREGYGDLQKEVGTILSQEVASKLYDQIYDNSPRWYRQNLSEAAELLQHISSAQDRYKQYYDLRVSYEDRSDSGSDKPPTGGDSPDPEPRPSGPGSAPNATRKYEPPDIQLPLPGFKPTGQPISDFIEAPEPSPVEPGRTVKFPQIEIARQSLGSYLIDHQPKAIEFFKSEMGKDLAAQPPKIITSKIKKELFKSLTDHYLILEPLVDVFIGAFDREVESKFKASVQKITDTILQDPGKTREVINAEAAGIVKSKDVSIPSHLLAKAKQAGEVISEKLKRIKSYIGQLDDQVNKMNMKISELEARDVLNDADKMIELLTCNIHENRIKAAKWLSASGQMLTKSQVSRITALLDNDDPKIHLVEGVYPLLYENIPVKYFAALALKDNYSPHLTNNLRVRAQQIVTTSRPGFRLPADDSIISRALN